MHCAQNVRQEIICVAQALLNEKGLSAFTMNYLTTLLPISKWRLHQNFSSKEELINTVLDIRLAEISRTENAIYQKSAPVLFDQLRQLLLVYTRILHPFHKMALEDLKRYYPNQWKKADEFRQATWQKIAALLHKEISRRRIHPIHPAILELIIHKLLQELLRSPPLPKEISSFDALNELIDIVVAGIINWTPTNKSDNKPISPHAQSSFCRCLPRNNKN